MFARIGDKIKEFSAAFWEILVLIFVLFLISILVLSRNSLYLNIPSIEYEGEFIAPEILVGQSHVEAITSRKFDYFKFRFPDRVSLIYRGVDTLSLRINPDDTLKLSVLSIFSDQPTDSIFIQIVMDASTVFIPIYQHGDRFNLLIPYDSYISIEAYQNSDKRQQEFFVEDTCTVLRLTFGKKLEDRNLRTPVYVRFSNPYPYKHVVLCINNKCYKASEGSVYVNTKKIKVSWKISSTNWIIYKYININADREVVIKPPKFRVVLIKFNTSNPFDEIRFRLKSSPDKYRSTWGQISYMQVMFIQPIPGIYEFEFIGKEHKVSKVVKVDDKSSELVISL